VHATADDAEIAVRDHGPGVAPDEQARVFDRYYQTGTGDHRGGMGLGLHISRQIVELHGGTIGVEDAPGGGARFVVRLPGVVRGREPVGEPGAIPV